MWGRFLGLGNRVDFLHLMSESGFVLWERDYMKRRPDAKESDEVDRSSPSPRPFNVFSNLRGQPLPGVTPVPEEKPVASAKPEPLPGQSDEESQPQTVAKPQEKNWQMIIIIVALLAGIVIGIVLAK